MVRPLDTCPCGSSALFNHCCEPLIAGSAVAKTAEVLMRSRFSAYVAANYKYILHTYTPEKQKALSIVTLRQNDSNSQWLKLIVHNHQPDVSCATVEFSAFYRLANTFHVLHERSNFNRIAEKWFYADGEILPDSRVVKLARNEACLCGSGKKYKQCCL